MGSRGKTNENRIHKKDSDFELELLISLNIKNINEER